MRELSHIWPWLQYLQTTGKQLATVIRVGARSPAPEGVSNMVRP
nr:hypothetical protein [uncultured Acetobacterium sp.]